MLRRSRADRLIHRKSEHVVSTCTCPCTCPSALLALSEAFFALAPGLQGAAQQSAV